MSDFDDSRPMDFPPDSPRSSNNSVQMNRDSGSQKDDFDKDEFGQLNEQHYEDRKMAEMVHQNELPMEIQEKVEIKDIKGILASSYDDQKYNQALECMLEYASNNPPALLLDPLRIILSKTYFSSRELSIFLNHVVFLHSLILKIKENPSIESYHEVIKEIMNPNSGFASAYYTVGQVLTGLSKRGYEIGLKMEKINQELKQEKGGIQLKALIATTYAQTIVQECMPRQSASSLQTLLFISYLPQKFYLQYIQSNPACLECPSQLPSRALLEQYSSALLAITFNDEKLLHKYWWSLVEVCMAAQSMERKGIGMKMIVDAIKKCREEEKDSKGEITKMLREWLLASDILTNHLKDDTHYQLLRKFPVILHFLSPSLSTDHLIHLLSTSLHGHQEFFKVAVSLVAALNIQQISEVFEMIRKQKQIESGHFSSLVAAVVAAVGGMSGANTKKTKNRKNPRKQTRQQVFMVIEPQNNKPEIKNNIIIPPPKEYEESDSSAESPCLIYQNSESSHLIQELFTFLMFLSASSASIYLPLLCKHLSYHLAFLLPILPTQIIELLRGESVNGLALLQQCLKMDIGGKGSTGKHDFVGKVMAEGGWEYVLAMLAKNRFVRSTVDKIINVIVLICRIYKPLDKASLEYLFKVLGEIARDTQEREQFFVFLQQLLRYDKTISEQSVNYLYFDILMKLSAEWYSPRVYECLERLFMRLNEDCGLLVYEADGYEVKDNELIGLDKFWYIYFNTSEHKTVKKGKEFLHKLTLHRNANKPALYLAYIRTISEFLIHSYQLSDEVDQMRTTKQIVAARAIEMIEILVEKKEQKKEEKQEKKLTIKIDNCTRQKMPPYIKMLQVNQKMTLAQLTSLISQTINPPVSVADIELMSKGKPLTTPNLTLAQLSISSLQTILVHNSTMLLDSFPQTEEIKSKIIDMFGELEAGFVQFIVSHYKGESAEVIIDKMLDQHKFQEMKAKWLKQKNEKQKEKEKEEEEMIEEQAIADRIPMECEPTTFPELLTSNTETLSSILSALSLLPPSTSLCLLPKIPPNHSHLIQLQEYISNKNWSGLFNSKNSIEWYYWLQMLSNYIKNSKTRQEVMGELGGRLFIGEWLEKMVEQESEEYYLYGQLLKLLVLSLPNGISKHFDQFMTVSQPISALPQSWKNHSVLLPKKLPSALLRLLSYKDIPIQTAKQMLKIVLQGDIDILATESPEEMKKMITKYGKAWQYCVRHAIQRKKREDEGRFAQYLLKVFNKLIAPLLSLHPPNSFFSLFLYLLSLLPLSPAIQIPLLKESMQIIMSQISTLTEEELTGHLRLIDELLSRKEKYENSQQLMQNEDRPQDIDEVTAILWLFNGYLFDLEHPQPHSRCRQVRKLCFSILLRLAHREQSIYIIEQSIAGLSIPPACPADTTLDFRNSEFIGLKNLGATCYINSLLQQLYHTQFARVMMDEDTQKEEEIDSKKQIKVLELKKIFMGLYSSIKNVVNPLPFINSITFYGEPINPLKQQDATEFLMFLFDHLEHAGLQPLLNTSFGGTLLNQITIQESPSLIKYNQEHFNSLSIDIKGRKNLGQAMVYFTKGQTLDGENMYFCEELGKKTKAVKKTFIQGLPNILIMTLKRFEFDYQTQTRHKLNDYFQFPLELDLTRYLPPQQRDKPTISPKYSLCGILIHSGSAESGHYYSLIKVGEKWYEFNDRLVKQINLGERLKGECYGGSQEKSRNAYMLWYERVGEQAHGVFLGKLSKNNKIVKIIQEQNQIFLKTRLVYDSNYIQFLQALNKRRYSQEIDGILRVLSPTSYKDQPTQPEIVHFDVDDDRTPLLAKQNDDWDKEQIQEQFKQFLE